MIRVAALALSMALAFVPAPGRAEVAVRLLAHSAAGTLDPQINYTSQYWQLFCFLYDGLVAFRKVAGHSGTDLVPDLAESLPDISGEGTVYRFRLRRGIRFSDGRPLGPDDVVASFRRLVAVHSPTAQTFYGAIESVSAEGDDVVLHLSRPDPELLQKLALPHASVLPRDAPQADSGTTALPGTGPYRVVRYDPGQGMRIERNPYFRVWNEDAQPAGVPDVIDYAFGLEDEAEITAIENDQADWTFDAPPADRLGELGARYPERVHINPASAIWFVPLNTRIPPFDDPRERLAFNLAVDRTAAVKLFGGPRLAVPSCQVLPPGLPGWAAYCPFPYDPQRARALVRQAGGVGRAVTLVTDDSPVQRALGLYLRDVLADLGFVASLRSLSGNVQFPYIQNTANRVQASLTSWYADYPAASNFLLGVFGCAAFHEASDSSPNISGFCDPALDARVLDAIGRGDLAALAAADRALTDAAPAVVLFSPRYVDVLSSRIESYAYHEVFHWLIGQARVR